MVSVLMEYAVVSTGGKQYRVAPGGLLDVERLDGAAGDEVRLEVLAVRKESGLQVGRPVLSGAGVKAQIVEQARGPKLIHFRFRRRKGFHRKVGHRQDLTRLKILEINL